MSRSALGLGANDYLARSLPASEGECVLHKYHSPRPDELHVHHVHPLGMGGKDVRENEIVVCPTGHANIHRLIRQWRAANGKPAWKILRQFSPVEREYAERAWLSSRG